MMLKWILEVEVDKGWVEDGFDFTKERIQDLQDSLVSFAYPGEVKIKVVKAPEKEEIRRIQGYVPQD